MTWRSTIEHEETCTLVEELAKLMGVDAEQAITIAVREGLQRIKQGEVENIASGAE